MAYLVTDYLEETVKKYPEKIAFDDCTRKISFRQLRTEAMMIAQQLIDLGLYKKPILVFLEKSTYCISSFIGAAYSGNFYSPLDTKMPLERIAKVIGTLKPAAIITDQKHEQQVQEFTEDAKIISIEEVLAEGAPDEDKVLACARHVIDTDILYVLFTSGSTGVPKGVIITHKAVVDYTDWISEKYDFNEKTILGNQAQLYFDLSIQDVYAPLKTGAKTVLIPNRWFVQPVRVWKVILKNNINTLVWIPSMLCLFANLDILAHVEKAPLEKVLFCGEVMPVKQLNYWIRNYPDVTYVNLYGPTECTDACTYYTIDRKFDDNDVLPMGRACENSEAFIIDENGHEITEEGIVGELLIRGSALSMGYYNNPEKTREVFVQNPLHNNYPETVYRTGDLVKYNAHHELVYVSRKDFQIKHRGYRIELGEIDAAATSIPEIEYGCCVFDSKRDVLILAYKGDICPEMVKSLLETKLQEYMVPTEYHQRGEMLFNINGKVDRKALSLIYCQQ